MQSSNDDRNESRETILKDFGQVSQRQREISVQERARRDVENSFKPIKELLWRDVKRAT